MKKYVQFIFLFFVFTSSYSQSGTKLFDNSFIHEIRIQFDTVDFWDILLENFENSLMDPLIEKEYLPAEICIDGDTLETVGVRIKGFFSSWGSQTKKKPLKVDINKFNSDQEYDGLKKFNLQNSYEDPSSMRDMLAYNIFNEAGIQASRSSYARVYLNKKYWGLYVLVEQVDKTFLGERFGDDEGNLYKNMDAHNLDYQNSADYYKQFFDLKTNETEDDWSHFIEFTKTLNHIGLSNKEYESEITEIFDVDGFLKTLAIDVLLLNWDSYYDHGRNYYIYDNPVNNRFVWIPWDYNLSFSMSDVHILFNEYNLTEKPLVHYLLDRPVFLQKYIDAYKDVLSSSFTSNRLFPIIDSTKLLISEGIAEDDNKFYSHKVFLASLEKDTMASVLYVWEDKFNIDSVYFGNNCQPIPDSIWESGIIVFDTCGMEIDSIGYDTVFTETEIRIYISITTKFEYEQNILGLKPFINRRIAEVTSQIQKVVIPEDPDLIHPLLSDAELVIYPNPANDFIILSGAESFISFRIRILDMSGKVLIEISEEEIIYLDNLQPGMYFLEFDSDDYREVRKFMKL